MRRDPPIAKRGVSLIHTCRLCVCPCARAAQIRAHGPGDLSAMNKVYFRLLGFQSPSTTSNPDKSLLSQITSFSPFFQLRPLTHPCSTPHRALRLAIACDQHPDHPEQSPTGPGYLIGTNLHMTCDPR